MNKEHWETNWEDFLLEDTGLAGSGNVTKWISQKWESLKDATKENIERAIQELVESAEAGQLFFRYASGHKLDSEEADFLKTQAKDIIKGLGLVGVIALPGGSVALKFLLDAAKKLGIELRPTAFVHQEGPESQGDFWPGSTSSATRQFGLMNWGTTLIESSGTADALAKTIASDVIDYLKNEFEVDDFDEDGFTSEHHFSTTEEQIDIDFSVNIGKTGTGLPFYIDTVSARSSDGTSLIEISLTFDGRYSIEQSFQDIYFKILEDARHELEHFTSQKPGGDRGLSRAEYYIDKDEVPSLVRGLHLKAKKMKIPTAEMFRQELEPYLKSAEINQPEYDIILSTWNDELTKIQGKTK